MHLGESFAQIETLFAADVKVAAIPFLKQVAGDIADKSNVKAYNSQLEAAYRSPGIAIVAIASDGRLEPGSETSPILDLWNTFMISITENPKTNETGLTAFEYTRRIMRLVHAQSIDARGARVDIKLDPGSAYSLEPATLKAGVVTYFVNLLVRTTEDTGAIDPS